MNYSIYGIYIVAGLIGLLMPISLQRMATIFIASIVLDCLRYQDIAVTNICLTAFVSKAALVDSRKKYIVLKKQLLPLMLLMAVVVVAALISNEVDRLRNLISIVLLIVTPIAIMTAINKLYDLESMINGLFWMSGLAASSVLLEVVLCFIGVDFRDGANQMGIINLVINMIHASGIFTSNAIAALHILPGLVLSAFLVRNEEDPKRRRKILLYSFFCTIALLFTLSRAGIISIMFLFGVLVGRGALRGRLLKIALLAVLVLGISPFLEWIYGFNPQSFFARGGILLGALQSIRQKPFLGNGLGAGVVSSGEWGFWGGELLDVPLDESMRDTHNTLLQILVEMGIVGLISFAVVVWVAMAGLCKVNSLAPRSYLAAYATSLFWTLVVLGFFLFFNSFLYSKPFWVVLGLAWGVIRIAKKSRPRATTGSRLRNSGQPECVAVSRGSRTKLTLHGTN